MELLTQKAYAESRGVSKQYINKLVKQGKIVLTGGKVDPTAADSAIAESSKRPAHSKLAAALPAEPLPTESVAPPDVRAPAPMSLTQAQTRKTLADAARAEIKLARERREVVATADAERAVASNYSTVRSLALGLPTKVAVKLANKTANQIRLILTAEIKTLLIQLAKPEEATR